MQLERRAQTSRAMLLADVEMDPVRIAQEMALMADGVPAADVYTPHHARRHLGAL